MNFRIGHGLDCHRLVEGIPLIIGGVEIEHDRGSKGHSDGDVLYHSLTDAFLGSIGARDIGFHFPSSDNKWKNADSSQFIRYAYKLVADAGYEISNIDSTIIIQEPAINPYIEIIKNNIVKLIKININNISIKATTTDYLGFIGASKGLCAISNVLVCNSK